MFGHDRMSRFTSPKKKPIIRPFTDSVSLKDPMESKKGVKIVDDWKVPDDDLRSLPRKAKEGNEESLSTSINTNQCNSPGPGSYNIETAYKEHTSSVILKPSLIEPRIEIKLEIPGPGAYFHSSDMIKPTFNRSIHAQELQAKSVLNQDKKLQDVEKTVCTIPNPVMEKVNALSSRKQHSNFEDRQLLKTNMKCLLSKLS